MADKTNLRFTQTQNGYFCEYVSGEWSINGVSGFSSESPEEAELNMWEILNKIRKAQVEINPILYQIKPLEEKNYRRMEGAQSV